MSYSLTPVLIDLPKLRDLMGSKDLAVLQAVIKKNRQDMLAIDEMGDEFFEEFEKEIKADYKAFVAGDLSRVDLKQVYPDPPDDGDDIDDGDEDEDDDDDEGEPTRETTTGAALVHLILGGSMDPSKGYKYGYALCHLCEHLGRVPDHDSWCSIRSRSVEAVDAVLKKAGVKPKTFSVEGHLQYRGAPVAIPAPDDFPAIGYLTRDEARTLLPLLDPAKIDAAIRNAPDDYQEWLETAIGELRAWLEACVKTDRDLICFYG
ncbi:MAG TPA: hypothetical protein VM597_28965 [Gemmataceae bacterium]|nr:hypothetical protein [Gemmataceae bacterium]